MIIHKALRLRKSCLHSNGHAFCLCYSDSRRNLVQSLHWPKRSTQGAGLFACYPRVSHPPFGLDHVLVIFNPFWNDDCMDMAQRLVKYLFIHYKAIDSCLCRPMPDSCDVYMWVCEAYSDSTAWRKKIVELGPIVKFRWTPSFVRNIFVLYLNVILSLLEDQSRVLYNFRSLFRAIGFTRKDCILLLFLHDIKLPAYYIMRQMLLWIQSLLSGRRLTVGLEDFWLRKEIKPMPRSLLRVIFIKETKLYEMYCSGWRRVDSLMWEVVRKMLNWLISCACP